MQKVIIDNRYRILKKCGTGATGTVYKVRDLKDKRHKTENYREKLDLTRKIKFLEEFEKAN